MLKDFTSLDPSEEANFVVFEQRMQADGKKAMTLGLTVSGIFGLLVVIIFFMGDADHSKWEEKGEEDSSSLGAESKKEDKADKPDPPKEEKKEAAEGEAAGGGEAAEGGEAAGGGLGTVACHRPRTVWVGCERRRRIVTDQISVRRPHLLHGASP